MTNEIFELDSKREKAVLIFDTVYYAIEKKISYSATIEHILKLL